MLILLFVFCLAVTVVGGCLAVSDSLDGLGAILLIVGAVAALVSVAVLISFVRDLVNGRIIDEQIALYATANAEIESEVARIAEKYMEFEKGTFESLKGESPITLTTIYPELKSNEIISRQIDLYIENNQKIIELKERKINITTAKWWVYFGK